jgi:hypothetical protein
VELIAMETQLTLQERLFSQDKLVVRPNLDAVVLHVTAEAPVPLLLQHHLLRHHHHQHHLEPAAYHIATLLVQEALAVLKLTLVALHQQIVK